MSQNSVRALICNNAKSINKQKEICHHTYRSFIIYDNCITYLTGTTTITIIFSSTRKVKNSSVRVEPSAKVWKRWTSTITLQLLNTLRKGDTRKVWIHHNSGSNGSPVLENTSYKKGALGWSTLKGILLG